MPRLLGLWKPTNLYSRSDARNLPFTADVFLQDTFSAFLEANIMAENLSISNLNPIYQIRHSISIDRIQHDAAAKAIDLILSYQKREK